MFAVGDICGKHNPLRFRELNIFLYSFEQVLSAAKKFWEYFQIKYAAPTPIAAVS